jgi:hypothetical protein
MRKGADVVGRIGVEEVAGSEGRKFVKVATERLCGG